MTQLCPRCESLGRFWGQRSVGLAESGVSLEGKTTAWSWVKPGGNPLCSNSALTPQLVLWGSGCPDSTSFVMGSLAVAGK